MKAIRTRYFGPTNHKGSRIRASEPDGKSLTIPYPYELNGEAAHRKAAEALQLKLKWPGQLVSGWLGGKRGDYVWVFIEETNHQEDRSHEQTPSHPSP